MEGKDDSFSILSFRVLPFVKLPENKSYFNVSTTFSSASSYGLMFIRYGLKTYRSRDMKEKKNKMSVCPVKTQISLSIRPV